MMSQALLLFPHQLLKMLPIEDKEIPIYLIEEFLFFKQYSFHKQKLVFHRASMKAYESYLKQQGFKVIYIESISELSDIRTLLEHLKSIGSMKFHFIDPTDNWLIKRIRNSAENAQIIWHTSSLFINSKQELNSSLKANKTKYFQTKFYKEQRKKRNILMQGSNPAGGRWTFDNENRKKYPKTKIPPNIKFPTKTRYHNEAIDYVQKNFVNNYGEIGDLVIFPIDFKSSELWLEQFLTHRFYNFGVYEDAIVKEENFLNHSLLSPLINVGLLQPLEVINRSIAFSEQNSIPINSTEGFVRQILGWREFIRGIYEVKGSEERTRNFWNFKRKIPASFYSATTGIDPIDDTIKKILKTGYAHHIERLMILGNFMVLCEFDPDEVYRWFMELFIDAYDWVMVPNVYGMSLYADGGIMSSKPYISSSNYIMKMSNYKKGNWQPIWDGLFWRFMDNHREFFLKNPRLGMLIRTLDKMTPETKETHLYNANNFLDHID